MIAKGRKSCASGSRQLGAIAITFPKAGLPIPTDPHIPICDYFRFADNTSRDGPVCYERYSANRIPGLTRQNLFSDTEQVGHATSRQSHFWFIWITVRRVSKEC